MMLNLMKIASMLKIVEPLFDNPESDKEYELSIAFEDLVSKIKGV